MKRKLSAREYLRKKKGKNGFLTKGTRLIFFAFISYAISTRLDALDEHNTVTKKVRFLVAGRR